MAFLRTVSPIEQGPVVQGDQVYLRVPHISDYSEWANLRSASRDFLTPWEPTWLGDELSRASFRRRVRHYQKDLKDETGYAFFLCRRHDNAILGGLTLSNVRRGVTQSCSLGYWIGAPFARKGLMTSGVETLIPFVFETLRLHRLEAACLPANTASIKLLDKTGFTREGLARRYLKINGIWQDHWLYAILEDDIHR